MHRILRSTSVRLALGYAGLFVISSMALIGLVWWNTTGYLDRETDAVIAADIRAIGDRLQDFGLAGAVQTMNERVLEDADKKAIYLLTDPGLRPLAGNVDAWPAEIGLKPGWHEADLVFRDKLHATRLLHVVLRGNFHLLVGRDVQERAAMRGLFLRSFGWAVLAALGFAAAGGFMIRRAVLRRIDRINRTTTAIVQGDLGKRVALRDAEDEFDQLAQTINSMLDQIQQLIEGVRNVSNAVAHDLRTPLAELRARLESLLRGRPSSRQMLDEISEAVGDIDRLIGIFNALLRLAEIDSGLQRAGFVTVNLSELAADMAELYAPSAEDRNIRLTLDATAELKAQGDPQLLSQAIGNLIDNAVKFTPRGGVISLAVRQGGDGWPEIEVADSGPGIPEEERRRVIQRFYRSDVARGTRGAGLGLNLVDAVVRLHGGSLILADNFPGLRATVRLPSRIKQN